MVILVVLPSRLDFEHFLPVIVRVITKVNLIVFLDGINEYGRLP